MNDKIKQIFVEQGAVYGLYEDNVMMWDKTTATWRQLTSLPEDDDHKMKYHYDPNMGIRYTK